VTGSVHAEMFKSEYGQVFEGDGAMEELASARGQHVSLGGGFAVREGAAVFRWRHRQGGRVHRPQRARALAVLGDSVTTDPHLPAGSIAADSPAGKYSDRAWRAAKDFNSYGARRGNHEVIDARDAREYTAQEPDGAGRRGRLHASSTGRREDDDFRRVECYRKEGVPLIVIAGKEYGTGSSRDWAAKGVQLLGVRAVIAENFERIHRSNLIGMGVLALEFKERRESAESSDSPGRKFFRYRIESGNQAAANVEGARGARGQDHRVRGDDARGHAGRSRVHPAWRNPPVRAARNDSRVTNLTAIVPLPSREGVRG